MFVPLGEVSSSAAATDEKVSLDWNSQWRLSNALVSSHDWLSCDQDKRDSTHNQLERHSSGKLDVMAPSRLDSPG